MKYIALLRGINVGGNNLIKMADLVLAFQKMGFKQVSTFIQSGNVLFESKEKSTAKLAKIIETGLSKTFSYDARVVIRSHMQLKDNIENIPSDWKTRNDIRCYMAFIREPVTVQQVLDELQLKEGIDFAQAGNGLVYLTTLQSGLTKSKLNKIISKKIFQSVTIRNLNTSQKILDRFEGLQ